MEEVALKDIALMDSAQDLWPENLDKAVKLIIGRPCDVSDVYSLICERKNIRHVIIAGTDYTSAEIRNTPLGTQLGAVRKSVRDMVGGVLTPARPTPETTFETVPVPGPQRIIRRTDDAFERYMEVLRRDNPNYAQFGDPPTPEQVAGIAPTVLQWNITWDEINPTFDGYATDPAPW